MNTLEKFEEKSLINSSEVTGGRIIEDTQVCFTIHWDGFFNGNLNLFDKVKGNSKVDEFDY